MKYRPDLDGLRAIAVTLVLIFHFSLSSVIKAGFIGVDVFFVISGFLITAILEKQLNDGTFSLWQFYLNRIRRLAPALLVVLFLTAFAGALFLFPNELVELSKQVIFSQLYVANIYFWRTISYFGLQSQDVFLLHTWSLAVEEQFYLVYPAFLLLLHRWFPKRLSYFIFLAFVMSFALNIFFVGKKPEATFYLFPTRAWELMVGALVSTLIPRWKYGRPISEIVALFGLGLIISGAIFYHRDFSFPGYYALLPTVGAACLISAGQNNETYLSRALGLSPIAYVGRISYSLYLVHWPINVFAAQMIDNYSEGWRIIMFLLSFVLAGMIYHTVENPLRHGHWLSNKRELLLSYTASLVATLSVVGLVITTGGVPRRFPADVVRLSGYVNDRTEPLPDCEFEGQRLESEANACLLGAKGHPTWLIYGDSHAYAAHLVLDKWLKSRGQAGLFFFHWACPPLIGIHMLGDKDNCFLFNQAIAKLVESNPDLVNIMLVSTWRDDEVYALSTSSDSLLTKEKSQSLFSERFLETAKYFHDLGRHVYIWEPVPGALKNVPLELARAAWEKRDANIKVSLTKYLSDSAFFFDTLKSSRKWITDSFAPSDLLCSTGQCAVTDENGIPLYYDNAHMTKSTADFWLQVLQKYSNR